MLRDGSFPIYCAARRSHQNGERLACPFTVNISFDNQSSYGPSAWGAWVELQPLLDLAWSRPTAGSSQNRLHFPPGITILVGTDSGDAFTCATNLARLLQDLNIYKSSVRTSQTTPDLVACKNQCVEMHIWYSER